MYSKGTETETLLKPVWHQIITSQRQCQSLSRQIFILASCKLPDIAGLKNKEEHIPYLCECSIEGYVCVHSCNIIVCGL